MPAVSMKSVSIVSDGNVTWVDVKVMFATFFISLLTSKVVFAVL